MDDKKFVMPEAEIIAYGNEDIITLSDGSALADWLEETDKEGWN